MDLPFAPLPLAIALLVGMLLCLEAGWRIGRRSRRQGHADTAKPENATGVVEGAVFALFGLLLAFAFSGATDRFDHRRELITQEANAIGTAYLRLDLLPTDRQPAIKALMRQYVQARLDTYAHMGDGVAMSQAFQHSQTLQTSIWREANSAIVQAGTPVLAGVVLPPLNDMFDITTTRLAATHMHPPRAIYAMLFALALVASLLAGYAMANGERRPRLHIAAFALIVSVTVYVTMDIEVPRQGLIRVDSSDQLLRDTLQGMR
jgi:hypothetical protein